VATWEIKGGGGGTSSKGSVIGSGTLNNLTETWTPLWYTSLGPTVYNLVVTCDKKEETVDTWTSTIVLCATEFDRYPTHPISLANLLPDPCKACALSFSGETLPVNEVGSTFTGSVDGEWSNQLNWKDVDGASPAGTLPGIPETVGIFTDDIVIEGDVLSCSLDAMPQVNVLTTDGGNIGISLSAVTATISGSSKVLLNGDCDTGGILYVTDPASFIDSSANEGTVVGNAVFEDSSKNTNVISGNATLKNTASFIPYFIQSASAKTESLTHLQVEGITTREACSILIGKKVWLPEAEFQLLVDKSSPLSLLGYMVVEKGIELGKIEEVIEQPHQLMVTILYQGQEAYITLHEESLKGVDHAKKQVDVVLPDGLLDLYTETDQAE
jgi:16S rRNA processing protein RimM